MSCPRHWGGAAALRLLQWLCGLASCFGNIFSASSIGSRSVGLRPLAPCPEACHGQRRVEFEEVL